MQNIKKIRLKTNSFVFVKTTQKKTADHFVQEDVATIHKVEKEENVGDLGVWCDLIMSLARRVLNMAHHQHIQLLSNIRVIFI